MIDTDRDNRLNLKLVAFSIYHVNQFALHNTDVPTHWQWHVPTENAELNILESNMKYLRAEFQAALHDKSICQRVANLHDLFIPILLIKYVY